ncbi:MAG: helix-turn-helix domain-containing protein, partial [Thermotogae bacterium]|nr:helix-turn-helix domain-containing protein [Thermotogota bacterium]
MIKHKAYRFRLYPNKAQQVIFAKTFGCVRFIYNKMLEDKIDYYQAHKMMLNTTPAQYKSEFEWLNEVDSLALANAQLNLQRAFKNFFQHQTEFPKFKSKHRGDKSYTTNNQNGSIRIEDGKYIKLPKMGLAEYDELEGIGWEWQSADGSMLKAPLAIEAVGKNPTDRGKKGKQ